jgi:hypothetical protein
MKAFSLMAVCILIGLSFQQFAHSQSSFIDPQTGKLIDPKSEEYKNTLAERDLVLAESAERERNTPIDQLHVIYIKINSNQYAPAYLNSSDQIAYQWKGVVLTQDQIPRFPDRNAVSGSFITPIIDPQKTILKINEIEPLVFYVGIKKSDKYAVGYYDRSNGAFYKWSQVELSAQELPDNVKEQNLIIDPEKSQMPISFSDVPPPAGYGSASTPPTPPTSSPSAVTATPSVSLPKTQASPSPTVQTAPVKAEQSSPPWTWGVVGLLLLAVFGGVWWKFLRK